MRTGANKGPTLHPNSQHVIALCMTLMPSQNTSSFSLHREFVFFLFAPSDITHVYA